MGGEGRTGRTGLDQRVGPKAHAVAHSALFRRRRARLLLTSDATARRSVAVCSGASRCLEPLRARLGHLVCGLGPALVASIEARPGAHWEHTAVRVWGWTRTRSTSVAAVEWSSVVCTPSRAHWVPCALVLHGFWSLQRSKSRSKHCQACVGGCGASMWNAVEWSPATCGGAVAVVGGRTQPRWHVLLLPRVPRPSDVFLCR